MKSKVLLLGHIATINTGNDKTVLRFYDNIGPFIEIWCPHHERVGAIDSMLYIAQERFR
jgi:hypothetical protein